MSFTVALNDMIFHNNGADSLQVISLCSILQLQSRCRQSMQIKYQIPYSAIMLDLHSSWSTKAYIMQVYV